MFKEIKTNYLVSEMQTEADELSGTVETWFPNLYPDKTRELNEYMQSACKSDDRLARNYKDLDYFNFPFVTTVKRDGKIIESGTGYTCPVYPNNCIRVMNRYYRATTSRPTVTTGWARPSAQAVVVQQLDMARRLNFETAIITRDRARRHFIRFIDALATKSNIVWEVSEKKYLLTPNADNPLAWQYVAYTNLGHNSYDFWQEWESKA